MVVLYNNTTMAFKALQNVENRMFGNDKR